VGRELARYTLMIPGPIELEPEVLGEMGRPLCMHYGREFADFYRETVALMRRVMLAERARAVFLVPGPGTAAIEMGRAPAADRPGVRAARGRARRRGPLGGGAGPSARRGRAQARP